MLFTLFIIVLCLIGLALLLLGIGMLIKKNGKFPETHIGRSKEMKKRGIYCANTTDVNERRDYIPIETQDTDKK